MSAGFSIHYEVREQFEYRDPDQGDPVSVGWALIRRMEWPADGFRQSTLTKVFSGTEKTSLAALDLALEHERHRQGRHWLWW